MNQITALFAFQNHSQPRGSSGFSPIFSRGHGNQGRGKVSNNQGRVYSFCGSSQRRGSGGRSSRFSQSNNRISCQICGRLGHSTLDCFNRMSYNFQGRHPPSQLSGMVASQNQFAAFHSFPVANFGHN